VSKRLRRSAEVITIVQDRFAQARGEDRGPPRNAGGAEAAAADGRRVPFLCIDSGLLFLALIYLVLTLPVFLGAARADREFDELAYHLPTIQSIRASWPQLRLGAMSYSAVAPGYHYLLASISLITGSEPMRMRLANWAISFALPALLYCFARTRSSRLSSIVLVLPLITSNFFIKSACWVLPDNAGTLMAAATVILLLHSGSLTRPAWKVGILAAVATAFRQVNLWLIAPICAKAIAGALRKSDGVREETMLRALYRLLFAIGVGAIPTLLVMTYLMHGWGGIVPLHWRAENQPAAFSTASAAVVLSLFGIFGGAYAISLGQIQRVVVFRSLIPAIAIGLLVSVATPTAYDEPAGRWGGYLWAAVKHLPAWYDRSFLFVILAPLGGFIIAFYWRRIAISHDEAIALTWFVSCAAWTAVFLVTRQIFQRYYEPMILVFLIVGAVCTTKVGNCHRLVRDLPLWILAIGQIEITYISIYR
jgi:hypothetical protein